MSARQKAEKRASKEARKPGSRGEFQTCSYDAEALPTGNCQLRPRTMARAFAFQALYQFSVTHESADVALARIWETEEGREADEAIRAFSSQLVSLVISHLDKIDDFVEKYAHSRALHRIPMVDLALIRLGGAELLYLSDVPPAVAINEMVELAHAFSTEESPSFLNAVLDRIQRHRQEIPDSQKAVSQWRKPH